MCTFNFSLKVSAPLSLTNMDSYIGPTAGNESAQIDIATNTEADILYGEYFYFFILSETELVSLFRK